MKMGLGSVAPVLLAVVSGADSNTKRIPSIVDTEFGPVQGRREASGFTTFHDVQYAADPVDHLRWRGPEPPPKWERVRPALEPGPSCPQLDVARGLMVGDEHCLHLSVYVPEGCTPETPCPVMHWIHGGAWIIGSNVGINDKFNGTKLASEFKVVVVSINYRLDVLGWMALEELQNETGSHGAYGNYGLRDQTFSLKWTQRNIKRFGGDPDKVTIFGQSAGGFAICQHLANPESNGLFSHAIMESGDCDGPWLILDGKQAQRFGNAYSDFVGCSSNLTATDRLTCLRKLSTKEILEPYLTWLCPFPRPNDPWCNRTVANANVPWPTPRPPLAPVGGWAAVVDGTNVGLPDTPYNLFKQGKINKSPTGKPLTVVVGTNEDEMAGFLPALGIVIEGVELPPNKEGFKLVAEHMTKYHAGWNQDGIADSILAAYPTSAYKTEAFRLSTATTDLFFRCGTRKAARALSEAGLSVYMYHFNFHPPNWIDPASLECEVTTMLAQHCGVRHADEVQYVFGNLKEKIPTPEQLQLSNILGQYWTNVARYGSPNGAQIDSANGLELWPTYNKTSDLHLEIALKTSVKSGLHSQGCDFWDSLPDVLN